MRLHHLLLFLLTEIFFSPAKKLHAQENQNLIVINYTSKNGLPQNSVNDMILDSGYLWLCTESGLVRFTGNRFNTYNISNTAFISNDHFKLMISTFKNEKLAMASDGNVIQIKANQMFPEYTNNRKLPRFVTIEGGLLSIEMLTGFVVPQFQKLQKYYSYIPGFVPVDHKSFLTKGTNSIFYYNYKQKLISFPSTGSNISSIFSFKNRFYYTDADNKLFRIDIAGHKLVQVSFKGDCENIQIQKPRMEIFWKSGSKIPVLRIGEKIYLIKDIDSNGNLITGLFVDKVPQNTLIKSVLYDDMNSQLFVGTDTKGLFVYRKKKLLSLINEEEDFGKNNAYYATVALDSNTILTSYGRLFTINGAIKNGLGINNFNRESYITTGGHFLWYAVNDTIFKYDTDSKSKKIIYSEHNNYITTFFESGDTVWVGSTYHIGYIVNDVYHNWFNLDKKIYEKPENIIWGPDGNLWFSCCSGVFSLKQTGGKVFAVCLLNNVCARYLYKYRNIIFVGTYGNGFYTYYDNRFFKMPLDENSYLSIAHSFLFDKNNFLWISSNHGLFKTSMADVLVYLRDTSAKMYYTYFGEDEGLRNIEFNGGCYPNSAVLQNGYFCFPTMDGIVFFDPIEAEDDMQTGKIYVDEIKVDGINRSINKALVIDPDAENLNFKLSTPYNGNRQNLSIEYKLYGFNKHWTKLPEGVSDISFSNLPSGSYILQIRKRTGNNVHQYVDASIPFTIDKKYYETSWFIIIMIVALISLVRIIVLAYYKNLKNRNLILERKIGERTIELRSLNGELKSNIEKLETSEKELRQSVNVKNKLISIISHDIVTPLRFISMVARNAFQNEKQPLNEIIKDIGGTSEKLYFNAQNILNWIKHQNQQIEVKKSNVAINPLVEDLVEMIREMAFSKGNKIINNVLLDDVIKTDKNILSIILHNLISNANKYCSDSLITISSGKENEHYKIMVEDNGNGIPQDVLQRINQIKENKDIDLSENSVNENGLGYIIIIEMLRLIDADIEIDSVPVKGTKVTLLF